MTKHSPMHTCFNHLRAILVVAAIMLSPALARAQVCCCYNGTCLQITSPSQCAISCSFSGGTIIASTSTCGPTACCAVAACRGACCSAGSCSFVFQSSCGLFSSWTEGVTCTPNPCPQPGACCAGDGTCMYLTNLDNCTGYQIPGGFCEPTNPCPQPGACCTAAGCSITTSPNCSGWFKGEGVSCGGSTCNAVCCAGLCCSVVSPANCQAAAGRYLGGVTACTAGPCTSPPELWVQFGFGGTPCGAPTAPVPTFAQAASSIASGGIVYLSPGTSNERLTVSRPMTLQAIGGTVTIGR